MISFLTFVRLLSFLTILTVAIATVPPAELDKRTGCTSDNCLRALKAQPSSASAFCSTYTTSVATATTGIPSYIPIACAPSRVSSACSCFVTPTATPTACPTGQVITWPNFYGCNYTSDYYDCGPQLAPWTITHRPGSTGCYLGNGYVWSYDADTSEIYCTSPEGGMLDHITQSLILCPGLNYTLTAHVGSTTQVNPGPSFKIYLDNQVLVPKQPPCSSYLYKCDPSWDGSFYREVTAVVKGPPSGKANFIIEVSSDTQGGVLLLDTITLTSQ